ncbi:MAG: hypothetical protein BWY80_01436 [Firmicutes bacterium ADurb.Bin456]|nr:MAG: hypothetical protein BWY80_01436 [Firmicutes bacterium ADurb.Bin456]
MAAEDIVIHFRKNVVLFFESGELRFIQTALVKVAGKGVKTADVIANPLNCVLYSRIGFDNEGPIAALGQD